MRAEHDLFGFAEIDEDGVEASSGRVPFGDVQRLEVVPGRLDLGTFGDGEAHTDENIFETVAGLRVEVKRAPTDLAELLAEIESLGLVLGGSCAGSEAFPSRCDRRLERCAGGIDGLTGRLSIVGIEAAQLLLGGRDCGLLAEELGVERGQRVEIAGIGKPLGGIGHERVEVGGEVGGVAHRGLRLRRPRRRACTLSCHTADVEHTVRDIPERQRYELVVDGNIVSIADYHERGDAIVVPHVETDPAHRGQGMADRLMAGVLADLRATNRKIVPLCPFADTYIRERPEEQDLLA